MARNLALIVGGAALLLLGQSAGHTAKAKPPVHEQASQAPFRGLFRPRPHSRPKALESSAPTPVDQPGAGQRFHGLLAADQADVRARIGAPDVARSEGSGAMWTYRLPDCALFVFFRTPKGAAPGQPPRVTGAASGPRVRGRSPPPVNDCIGQALNRRAAAPPSAGAP